VVVIATACLKFLQRLWTQKHYPRGYQFVRLVRSLDGSKARTHPYKSLVFPMPH
jgi:hypothetical protein